MANRLIVALVLIGFVIAMLPASATQLEVDGGKLQAFYGAVSLPPSPMPVQTIEAIGPASPLSGQESVMSFRIPLPGDYVYRRPAVEDLQLCPGNGPCEAGIAPLAAPAIERGNDGCELVVAFDAASVRQMLWPGVAPASDPRTATVSGMLYAWPPVVQTNIVLR